MGPTNYFFSKCSKLYVDSKNAIKYWQKVFEFGDKCIWIASGTFSLLWREYLSLAVNVLTNSSKISDLMKREVFWLNLSQSVEKVA